MAATGIVDTEGETGTETTSLEIEIETASTETDGMTEIETSGVQAGHETTRNKIANQRPTNRSLLQPLQPLENK
jgi:hypothetical protein